MDRESILSEVCARLAKGEPLSVICRREGMPSRQTIYDWREQDEDVARRIAKARVAGFDAIADEALEIADTPLPGKVVTVAADGTRTVTEDMLGHRKLQVDTRLKLLAVWDPGRYGNKVDVTSTGRQLVPLDDTAAAAKLASIMARAQARLMEKETREAEQITDG